MAPQVKLGPITTDNIEQLRGINLACFPVKYQESFYEDVVQRQDEGLCKVAYHKDTVVGAVCCRVEPFDETKQRIYIMTLGVLAPYRGHGIGSTLIGSVLRHYDANKDGEYVDVEEICLHVQTSNQDAIDFYTTRFGFTKGALVKNYYRRIDPPHCYILAKRLKT